VSKNFIDYVNAHGITIQSTTKRSISSLSQ